jgi:hypothetical protein
MLQLLPFTYLPTYLLARGAEPFWRSRQFCSYSRISQHFKENEGSLPFQSFDRVLLQSILCTVQRNVN